MKILLILAILSLSPIAFADTSEPRNNLSCLFHFLGPSWLGAHQVDSQWSDQEELFLETIIMALEGIENNQKERFSSVADTLGLDNSIGDLHLIEAVKIALENYLVEIPGTENMRLLERRRDFSELLTDQFEDRREQLYWGFRAYERFMRRNYSSGTYMTGFLDYGLGMINREYYRVTRRRELKDSLREVFSQRFSEEPELITSIEYDGLLELTYLGFDHFAKKESRLRQPHDLVGDSFKSWIGQFRENTVLAGSEGLTIYKELTDEMDLSPIERERVAIKIEEFITGATTGVMLNLIQLNIGDRGEDSD